MSEQESEDLKEIKEHISEIKTAFTIHYSSFYKELNEIFNQKTSITKIHTLKNTELIKLLNIEQSTKMRLINERNELINVIAQETCELQQFESENDEVAKEIVNLKNNILMKKDNVLELENECDKINKKLYSQEQKRSNKEKVYKELADKFRNVLGMEIVPLKQNVLKIVVSGSYFVVDFGNESAVVGCFPLFMKLDELNCVYEEKDNIYEFVKWIRKEFNKYR